jgi:uncharacterized repeat protein (TIGR01451 family)
MKAARKTVVSGLIAMALILLVLAPANPATAATADLSVTVTASDVAELTYAVSVHNGGPDAATNVSVVVTLPGGIIPISVTPDGPCAFNPAGTTVNCSLGSLANGATTAVTVVVHAITIGLKTGTATVSAPEVDPTPGDNTHSDSVTLTAVGISDMTVTLEDMPDPNKVGRILVYLATATNIQDDSAQDVVVSIPLPNTVFFLAAASERGACTVVGRTVNCPLGVINPSVSVRAAVVVVPLAPGYIFATAGVALTTPDPNANNNSATARTWVNP